jgi:RHH-type rel operon transcriptional repressor/antitoxin RelB
MNTDTVSVRLARSTKARLQQLAKSTGRSRAFLAAEAIEEYLDINEWQVAGILGAIASLDRGKGFRASASKNGLRHGRRARSMLASRSTMLQREAG